MVQAGRILLIKFNKFKNSGVGLEAGTINKYFNLNGANLYNYSGIPECMTGLCNFSINKFHFWKGKKMVPKDLKNVDLP